MCKVYWSILSQLGKTVKRFFSLVIFLELSVCEEFEGGIAADLPLLSELLLHCGVHSGQDVLDALLCQLLRRPRVVRLHRLAVTAPRGVEHHQHLRTTITSYPVHSADYRLFEAQVVLPLRPAEVLHEYGALQSAPLHSSVQRE